MHTVFVWRLSLCITWAVALLRCTTFATVVITLGKLQFWFFFLILYQHLCDGSLWVVTAIIQKNIAATFRAIKLEVTLMILQWCATQSVLSVYWCLNSTCLRKTRAVEWNSRHLYSFLWTFLLRAVADYGTSQ